MALEQLFNHESLQDRRTIRKYLKAITDGIAKGSFTLADGGSKTRLEPDGLIRIRLEATDDNGRKAVTIRLDWDERELAVGSDDPPLLITSETKP